MICESKKFNPKIKYKMFGLNIISDITKKNSTMNNSAIIVHGGTFTYGDETWNNVQAKYLSDKWKMNIYTIDFSKKSLEDSINDICDFYRDLIDYYKVTPGLIGISSGGFLVLQCLKHIQEPSFIYLLGPVICPKGREKFVTEIIKNKQKKYFNDNVPEKANFTRSTFYVIISNL